MCQIPSVAVDDENVIEIKSESGEEEGEVSSAPEEGEAITPVLGEPFHTCYALSFGTGSTTLITVEVEGADQESGKPQSCLVYLQSRKVVSSRKPWLFPPP